MCEESKNLLVWCEDVFVVKNFGHAKLKILVEIK
jgi:hypothetical protein